MKEIVGSLWLVTQWLGVALEMAILAGMSAAMFGLAVWLVDRLLRRWITPGQMAVLWLLVLLRLVIPFGPESAISLQGITKITSFPLHYPDAGENPGAIDPTELWQQPMEFVPPSQVSQDPLVREITRQETVGEIAFEWNDLWVGLLLWTWAGVGGIGLVWAVQSYLVFCRKVAGQTPVSQGSLAELWKSCCHTVGYPSAFPMVLLDHLAQPAIQGFLRPRLLWPRGLTHLTDAQARMVMFHELGHVKRCDIVTNWVLLILRAIHWWNPIYWLAANRLQQLREQACDAFALRAMGGTSTRDYGELLLSLSQTPLASGWKAPMPVSVLGFFTAYFRKQSLGQRLRALSLGRLRPARFQKLLVAFLILVMGWAGLTDARSPAPESATDPVSLSGNTWTMEGPLNGSASGEPSSATAETRDYPIGVLLNRLARNAGKPLDAQHELEGLARLVLGSKQQNGSVQVRGEVLSLTTTPELHKLWEGAQKSWERHGLDQVVVEVKFIQSSIDVAKRAGISWKNIQIGGVDKEFSTEPVLLPSGSQLAGQTSLVDLFPMGFTTLEQDEEIQRFLTVAQSDRRTNVLMAPKITQFQGLPAKVSIAEKQNLVVGFQEGSKGIREPVSTDLETGLKMILKTSLLGEGRSLKLDAQLVLTRCEDVSPYQVEWGAQSSKVDLPRLHHRKISVSQELQSGQSLLVGCFPTPSARSYQYYLFTVRRLDEGPAAQP